MLFKNKNKWKLFLYYDGILVKKIKINQYEEPFKNNYAVNIFFKKQLFNSNFVNAILKPVRLLKKDEKHRKTYWGTIIDPGEEIK